MHVCFAENNWTRKKIEIEMHQVFKTDKTKWETQ